LRCTSFLRSITSDVRRTDASGYHTSMKTDPSIYEFLATDPEAFRVLTDGLTLNGAYHFASTTLKTVERRLDGLYKPIGHDGPAYVVEFQGQPAPAVWYNLLAKIGLYGEQAPNRQVQGILIFLQAQDDPGPPPGAVPPLVRAVHLDRVLPAWRTREPDNPFVAALAPLIIPEDEKLRAFIPTAWRKIQTAPLVPSTRGALGRVLEFWLLERFPFLTTEALRVMLGKFVPIEQSLAYQEIFAKGEARGKAEGEARGKAEGEARGEVRGETRGKAESMKRLLTRRFGPLPKWAVRRLETAAVADLDAWLEGIFDAQSLEGFIGPRLQGRRPPKAGE